MPNQRKKKDILTTLTDCLAACNGNQACMAACEATFTGQGGLVKAGPNGGKVFSAPNGGKLTVDANGGKVF